MNRINRKLEYALMALKHMALKPPGQLSSVKEICLAYGCPFDATSRVLQALVGEKILHSEHGAHGGYKLKEDLAQVSVYQLIEAILGPMGIARCLHDADGACEIHHSCNIVSPIVQLNRRLVEFYRQISVRDLIGGSPWAAPDIQKEIQARELN